MNYDNSTVIIEDCENTVIGSDNLETQPFCFDCLLPVRKSGKCVDCGKQIVNI